MLKRNGVLIVVSICVIFLIFLGAVYFYFPTLDTHLQQYRYNNESKKADEISKSLSRRTVFSNRMKCWDMGSRCGVQLIFSTSLPYTDAKNKVENSKYKKMLSTSADGNTVYTLLNIDAGKRVQINGEEMNYKHYLQENKYEGWSWWLVDENNKNYSISLFNIDSVKQDLNVDGKNIDGNVMEIVVYTKK